MPSPASQPLIDVQQLTRSLPDGRKLVDDISFTVHRGEVVSIIGPSGSGKSSLLRLINRLDEPTGGRVLIDGVDHRQIPPGELRRRATMVMQRADLFPGTVADNLRWAPAGRGEHISDERIAHLLSRVHLDGYADRDVEKLSGGEAQRVSLARGLANSPDVLLLDEPTSALDEHLKAELEETLAEIFADGDLTCLIITHDLAQAARMARRTLRIKDGRLAADDRTEALEADPEELEDVDAG